MKKIICIALIFISLIILVGCANPGPYAPTVTATVTQTVQATSIPQPITKASVVDPDQAWVTWALKSNPTITADLQAIFTAYPNFPYNLADDQPALDRMAVFGNQLATDCQSTLKEGNTLTSRAGMKIYFESYKSALSLYFQAGQMMAAKNSSLSFLGRIAAASADFQNGNEFMKKANPIPSP